MRNGSAQKGNKGLDEFVSIRHWTNRRQDDSWQRMRGVTKGIGDDAASVDLEAASDGISGGKRLLLAVDTMVETVHFADCTMRDEDVGFKALAATISDIAAMGGVPLHALVSVSMPKRYGADRMKRVYDGLYACAARYGIAVVGGDTTSSPEHMVISVTLTGTVEAGEELLRSGAKPGDAIFVTGPVGMSAAGLHLLQAAGGRPDSLLADDPSLEVLLTAHQRPVPSVLAGRLLLRSGACRSLNDISDGLASEAWELAEASGLRLVLEQRLLPKSGSMCAYAAQAGVDPLEWMLYGGEDYVLVGTVARPSVESVKAAFKDHGLPFYVIGETEEGEPGVELLPESKRWDGKKEAAAMAISRLPLAKRGYNHFGI